ncbi:hypothetical protein [Sandaracinobacteroides saxicola]|nr:hypothetical protein [Sandaracinobacteroides saxicola]
MSGPPYPQSRVPGISSWSMMIAGFGLLGLMLRRQRRLRRGF